MVRPASMIWFERIMLCSFAMAFLSLVLTWDRLKAGMPPDIHNAGVVMGVMTAILSGLVLLLLWLVSRRRSRIARWFYVLYYGLGLVAAAFKPATALYWGIVPAVLTIAQYLCIAASLWLLFRPDARHWFRKEAWVDPEIFR
jgi:hypothetical protein